MLRKFRDLNVRASWATTPRKLWDNRAFGVYDRIARQLLQDPDLRVVVDLGGGRTWHFGQDCRQGRDLKIIGVDIDADELALNTVIDQAIVANVCETLGVEDGSVDLVLCRATVEHLPDTASFIRNVHRALKPGGKAAFVFANKWAPPLILNRMIPNSLATRLLNALVPGAEGYQGFRAYYDKCSHNEFLAELKAAGFNIEVDYTSYYSSSYFQFFLPLHAVSIALDLARQATGIKNISSMNLFVVSK